MSSDYSWKCQWTGTQLMEMRSVFQGKGQHVQNNACQNLSDDSEVSSSDVYPQIVEASQSKLEPCHVQPFRPATWSCNLFFAQLAASVALSALVLNGHISAAMTQCERHYSGSVVDETLNIYWCHKEGYCNHPNGMSLQNLSFQSCVRQYTFEFHRWTAADI